MADERISIQREGTNSADMKSAYAELRLKASKEADRQDKSDELPEQKEQDHTKKRGIGRSRSR